MTSTMGSGIRRRSLEQRDIMSTDQPHPQRPPDSLDGTPKDETVCAPSSDGLPTCSTGPAGRLSWTLREIINIVRRRS